MHFAFANCTTAKRNLDFWLRPRPPTALRMHEIHWQPGLHTVSFEELYCIIICFCSQPKHQSVNRGAQWTVRWCVVDEQSCVESGRVRQRWRSVVRHPDPDVVASSSSSGGCPALEETERCDAGTRCATYSRHWGDWGRCQTYHSSVCGPGRHQRHYQCIRDDDGLVVSRSFCADNVCPFYWFQSVVKITKLLVSLLLLKRRKDDANSERYVVQFITAVLWNSMSLKDLQTSIVIVDPIHFPFSASLSSSLSSGCYAVVEVNDIRSF